MERKKEKYNKEKRLFKGTLRKSEKTLFPLGMVWVLFWNDKNIYIYMCVCLCRDRKT